MTGPRTGDREIWMKRRDKERWRNCDAVAATFNLSLRILTSAVHIEYRKKNTRKLMQDLRRSRCTARIYRIPSYAIRHMRETPILRIGINFIYMYKFWIHQHCFGGSLTQTRARWIYSTLESGLSKVVGYGGNRTCVSVRWACVRIVLRVPTKLSKKWK